MSPSRRMDRADRAIQFAPGALLVAYRAQVSVVPIVAHVGSRLAPGQLGPVRDPEAVRARSRSCTARRRRVEATDVRAVSARTAEFEAIMAAEHARAADTRPRGAERCRWAGIAEAIWEHDTAGARLGRAAAGAGVVGSSARIVSQRNARFDATAPTSATVIPAMSIGNLTVGGTGKTPMAAWCVRELRARGAQPAIVMRGVGDDEWRVHGLLNPGIPVVVSPDRAAGLIVARTRGADCAVLDDAFQHRRARRVADIVLLSADRWTGAARLLPAGPFREPLSSLRRADVVVITVKAAERGTGAGGVAGDQCRGTGRGTGRAAPRPGAAAARRGVGQGQGIVSVRRSHQRSPAGPADPSPRVARRTRGERGERHRRSGRVRGAASRGGRAPARHRGDSPIITRFARPRRHRSHARRQGRSGVVCTLKDAVKLAPCWPREAPPLWYLSQSVVVDRGAEALDRAFARVLAARAATAPTAG